jgi:Ion channel/Pentapeptide repeats (8 copies)
LDLEGANLTGANLIKADLSGANITNVNFSDSCLTAIKWNPKKMHGLYQGIRGIDSSYGNALFKRAAADQDYLDTLEARWKERKGLTFLFKLWGLIDYGRSIGSVIVIAFVTIALFGLTYSIFPGLLGLDCVPNTEGCNRHSWFTPFYFSIVTFTTLGYGDITPKNLAGELIVSLEVVLGYLVLGLLISVLADKVVRRS